MSLDKKIIAGLRKRYSLIHPLIFQRSVDKAESEGELFDILDSIPDEMPVIWDKKDRRWVVTSNPFQKNFTNQKEKE